MTDLSTILRAVTDQEDTDLAFILAGVINLYVETIQRRGIKRHLDVNDIFQIGKMLDNLLGAGSMEQEMKRLTQQKREQ